MAIGYDVAELLSEIASLKARAERAEREREEYQSLVHDLNERRYAAAFAAKGAAESAVTAIERIQALEARADRDESVVRAADRLVRAYVASNKTPGGLPQETGAILLTALIDAVIEHQKRGPS